MNSVKSMTMLVSNLRQDRRGASIVVFMLTLLGIMGSAATVVDVGNAFVARRSLQSSADAAALAGAAEINCCSAQAGKAITTATNFSAVAGKANANNRWAVTMAEGFPQLKCLSSIGVPCTGPDSANAIVVQQRATVPTYFARLFGLATINVAATATASLAGGTAKPLDVMMVLDTTGSMNTNDPACEVSNSTRLRCAQAGGRKLLQSVAPSVSKVGLIVFPGTTSASEAAKNYDCSTSQPAIAKYSASPLYSVLPLGSDFRAADDSTSLNTSSNLSKSLKGGSASCSQGISAVGGIGTYFADAITQAQATLTNTGRTDTQKVIIFLSDGDASAPKTVDKVQNMTNAKHPDQCKQGITAAKAATAAGTWVYTIAYGAPTSASGSCPTDTTRISACSTMQQMASDPGKFYSSGSGSGGSCGSTANPTTGLVSIFDSIAQTFKSTRLLPNGTT